MKNGIGSLEETKGRRRFELNLSNGLNNRPNLRTIVVMSLAFMLAFAAFSVTGLGKEVKVTDVNSLLDCVRGLAIGTTAPTTSPDVGKRALPGDVCVVFPGTYDIPDGTSVNITVENLTLRSTNGLTATLIIGNVYSGLINVADRGVTVGGPAADQGFAITNEGGAGICVTDGTTTGEVCPLLPAPFPAAADPAAPANENITIQNNSIRDNHNEGILFTFDTLTAIDTIRILNNEIIRNKGDGIGFDSSVGAVGRRGMDRNIVIDGNYLDRNANGGSNRGICGLPLLPGVDCDASTGTSTTSITFANIHFYNSTTIEQLAIIDNEIYRAGIAVQTPATQVAADGILFDHGEGLLAMPTTPFATPGVTEVRDSIIDGNLIQYNSRNGIKVDYDGRFGEGVIISNNRGVTPEQGITHNGPASLTAVPDYGAQQVERAGEGNGIYITPHIREVRGLQIINNAINSNRGWDGTYQDDYYTTLSFVPCRDGNGLSIEANGRVEDILLDGNDFRQNFNNGVCIANNGDFDPSTITNNLFDNNGVGDLMTALTGAPYGDGFGVYHDSTINEFDSNGDGVADWGDGFRVEDITFSGNMYRENGDTGPTGTAGSGLGFGLFIRTERAEISRISFTGDQALRNYLGNFRLETDSDSVGVRSGDIREISFTDVVANEAQGNPTIGAAYDVADNGDGIGLITDNGDFANITVDPTEASHNGGIGLRIESDGSAGGPIPKDQNETTTNVTPGDIDNVHVTDSTFNFNGERAAVGLGDGILMSAESVRNVTVDPTTANNNNDHGLQIAGSRNVSVITVENSTFNNNDRNRDTVGDGVQIAANEDISQIIITGNTANSNYAGFRVGAAGREIGQEITIESNMANDNTKEGIALFAGRDLIDGSVLTNTLLRNGIGISLVVVERGSNIEVAGNLIKGEDGQGIGILLDAIDVTIHDNAVRRNATGIEVRRATQNSINYNNIARNEDYGVDANALQPGEAIDATNNWWAEPSGPKHVTNPGGIGDRVSNKVNFIPFLDEPVCTTDLICPSFFFEITAFNVPATADVGEEVTITATIENTGTEEGTRTVELTIKRGGTVVAVKTVDKTINPAASVDITFTHVFTAAGEYTVELRTVDDFDSKTITVGPPVRTIEAVVAAYTGDPTIIEDADILWAIEQWIAGADIDGLGPITDGKILELIDLWVTGTPVTSSAAEGAPVATAAKNKGFFGWLASLFAPKAVVATQEASLTEVNPGDVFTVTVSIKADAKGLLLSTALPEGWIVTPVDNAGAFFKPSETKWLFLSLSGRAELVYQVWVPEDATPGVYQIATGIKAASPDFEGTISPLTIAVTGEAVEFAVSSILLYPNPVVGVNTATLVVEGTGIESVRLQVFNLAGALVFDDTEQGNTLHFHALDNEGRVLANGVYLYIVTVKGQGEVLRSEVRKLVILR